MGLRYVGGPFTVFVYDDDDDDNTRDVQSVHVDLSASSLRCCCCYSFPITSPTRACRFDNLEMALFRIGQAERTLLEQWNARLHGRIEATQSLRSWRGNLMAKRSKPLTQSNPPAV